MCKTCAVCAVVSCLDCQDQICRLSVTCIFKVKAEDKSWVPFTCQVGSWTRNGDGKDKIESDYVFFGYTSCPQTMDGNSDKCNPSEASLKFTLSGGTSEKAKFRVLKCGLSLVYAKDKTENSSHEAKYDMPVGNSFPETSEGVDGGVKQKKAKYETPVNGRVNSEEVDERVKKLRTKYNMQVEKSCLETSEAVDGKVKRKKNTRRDDGRLKKKQRSVVKHMVENLQGGGQSVLNEFLHKTPFCDEEI